jgi:hypothetical protein
MLIWGVLVLVKEPAGIMLGTNNEETQQATERHEGPVSSGVFEERNLAKAKTRIRVRAVV